MQGGKQKQTPARRRRRSNRIALYERLKAEWIAQNPWATPAQCEAAMLVIARQVGV
jgi:hypothetical protein